MKLDFKREKKLLLRKRGCLCTVRFEDRAPIRKGFWSQSPDDVRILFGLSLFRWGELPFISAFITFFGTFALRASNLPAPALVFWLLFGALSTVLFMGVGETYFDAWGWSRNKNGKDIDLWIIRTRNGVRTREFFKTLNGELYISQGKEICLPLPPKSRAGFRLWGCFFGPDIQDFTPTVSVTVVP